MRQEDRHVSDEDLIQALDGELPAGRAAAVDRHLAACWTCRSRRGEIETSIAGLVAARRQTYERQIPSAEGPRALLQARMTELSEAAPAGLWSRMRSAFEVRRLSYSALAIAAVLAGALYFAGGQQWTRQVYAMSTPDSALTPGATLPVTREYVCAARESDGLHVAPARLARQVFEQYGVAPAPRAYEVDYLITPALGGAADIRNLWPQPYASGIWNARVKDALEDHLQRMVCEGHIELAAAQGDIASDWVAAYKKYFDTEHPLASHAAFSKDLPWE
jgi:hypothetical protein